jgi:mobilization protein NikA
VCVFVRITDSEHEALITSARLAGLSVASYLREAGLNRPIKASPSLIDLQLVQELNRLGNNLNQLLVLAHTHRIPVELGGAIETLLVLVHAIHQKLTGQREGEPQ